MAGLLLSISFSSPHRMLRWSSIRNTRMPDAVATVDTPLHGDGYVDDGITVGAEVNDGLASERFDPLVDGPRRKVLHARQARIRFVPDLQQKGRILIEHGHKRFFCRGMPQHVAQAFRNHLQDLRCDAPAHLAGNIDPLVDLDPIKALQSLSLFP